MQQSDPFVAIAILLAAALLGGLIAHRLRQPVILGYLIIGVVVGPHSLGLIGDLDIVEAAATIGVSLLMFTLGMETSIVQLREAGRIGVWGGILQIFVTAVVGLFVGMVLFQWPITQSIIFGLILSLGRPPNEAVLSLLAFFLIGCARSGTSISHRRSIAVQYATLFDIEAT